MREIKFNGMEIDAPTLFAMEFSRVPANVRQNVIKGPDITPEDGKRIAKHLENFIAYVSDRKEHTHADVASALGMAQTSASARWRDLKKLGGDYEKRRDPVIKGLWWFRLTKEPKG